MRNMKELIAVIIILTVSITPVLVLAGDYYSDGSKFDDDNGLIYRDDESRFEFFLNAEENLNYWTYDVYEKTWTWSGTYTANKVFYFEVDMKGDWLHSQEAEIFIREPGDLDWTSIAHDKYGSDSAECDVTMDRHYLRDSYGEFVGEDYYETEVRFYAKDVIFSDVNRWYSTFTIKYKG